MRRVWPVAVFIFGGWLFAASSVLTDGLSDALLRHRYLPALPTVAAPYDPTTDVVSVIPFLFRALLLAGVGAGIAGGGKMFLAIRGRTTPLAYTMLTAIQGVLFIEVFRALAPDWAIYAVHFARLLTLSDKTYALGRRLPWGAPWISFAICILLGWIVIRDVLRLDRGKMRSK